VSEERWVVIPGWDRFQHYKDRDPPWIKLYTDLIHNEEWLGLTCHQRGVLVSLWVEYAASGRQLRGNTATLTRRLGDRVTNRTLERLRQAGFVEFSASKPLAPRYQDASPEGEGEREGERERKKVERKKPRYVDPTRSVPRNGTVCPHCGVPVSGPHALAEHIDNVHW